MAGACQTVALRFIQTVRMSTTVKQAPQARLPLRLRRNPTAGLGLPPIQLLPEIQVRVERKLIRLRNAIIRRQAIQCLLSMAMLTSPTLSERLGEIIRLLQVHHRRLP